MLAPCTDNPKEPGYGYCNADCDEHGYDEIEKKRCETLFTEALNEDRVRRESCSNLSDGMGNCFFPTCGTKPQCDLISEHTFIVKWLISLAVIIPVGLILFICYRTPNLNDIKNRRLAQNATGDGTKET